MEKKTIKARLMSIIASIGWKLFIYGNQTTEEKYWNEIYAQEAYKVKKSQSGTNPPTKEPEMDEVEKEFFNEFKKEYPDWSQSQLVRLFYCRYPMFAPHNKRVLGKKL